MLKPNFSLAELGFSAYFLSQLQLEELEHFVPVRVMEVHRDRLAVLGENGQLDVALTTSTPVADFAVGDWVLLDTEQRLVRALSPKSSLCRRAAGTDATVQLIANNVDTLFIVTSCNADFNEARLERYLALAKDADVTAVIILTKVDLVDNAADLQTKAERLMEHLSVLALNATQPTVVETMAPWCGTGQTVALLGSSGVGKTTLLNMLTGEAMVTQAIREDDSKGKHTTTYRAMRPMVTGGWVIDTPGMRALRLYDSAEGIDAVFDEIIETATRCRFTDCRHESEPGCAVQAAIDNGELEVGRLNRWRKLQREDLHNTRSVAETRKHEKQFVKAVNKVVRAKQQRKTFD